MKGTLIKVFNHDDETAVIVYRDENLEKKKIVKTNMVVDYFLLKEGNDPHMFVKQEDCERFEAPYNQLIPHMVSNLDVVDPTFKEKAEVFERFVDVNFRGAARPKLNLFRLPGVYGADEPLENRAIEWFHNNFEEDDNYNPNKYTAFFDIETDLMPNGKKKRDGAIDLVNTPDPVNIISLYYQGIMYVFAYDYGNKNESYKKFISNLTVVREEMREKMYERINAEYQRGNRTVKGKEIKLDEVKVSLHTSEHELIRAFFNQLHELDPDFLFAWNMSFDVKTLFGRLEKTQQQILRLEGEESNIYAVKNYTRDFIASPKYAVDQFGNRFSPNYFYYESGRGEYQDAKERRDYAEICDGTNWIDQLIVYAILNKADASDSDALEEVSTDMFGFGKVPFDLGENIFNLAWLNYVKFFEYNIQDVLLLKKIEDELQNASEVFELSYLYKCAPKDAFAQTKSTKSFMGYIAKQEGYVLRNNVNALYNYYADRTDSIRKYFDDLFGMDVRSQQLSEITGTDFKMFRTLLDRDNHGGFVLDGSLNSTKNAIELYEGIRSDQLFGPSFDKDYSSLYPSTKHAFSIDDDGAVARYAIYDDEIREKQRERGYEETYVWRSAPKRKDIQDHWAMTNEGNVEDQNLMIRLYDFLVSQTYSKIGEDFLRLPTTTEIIEKLIKGGK